MGVKKRNTGLGDGLEKIFEENTSDRPSLKESARIEKSAAAASSVAPIKERKKKARLTAEERRNMHPVQTFLNEEEWAQLKMKLITEKVMQEEFIYQAVMKAIKG